jgi:hypothetical protein
VPGRPAEIVTHTACGTAGTIGGVAEIAHPLGGFAHATGAPTAGFDINTDRLTGQPIDGAVSGRAGDDSTRGVTTDIYGCISHKSPPNGGRKAGEHVLRITYRADEFDH